MRAFDELDAARMTLALGLDRGWSVESSRGEPLCGFVPTAEGPPPLRLVLRDDYFSGYLK